MSSSDNNFTPVKTNGRATWLELTPSAGNLHLSAARRVSGIANIELTPLNFSDIPGHDGSGFKQPDGIGSIGLFRVRHTVDTVLVLQTDGSYRVLIRNDT